MDTFQLDLQEHCALLSRALSELAQLDPKLGSSKLLLAADWLNLAAGVCRVDVQTDRFDESTQYCSGADRFEHARSTLLSRLATHLTIFNFAWGAFETVAKFIDPSPIPAAYRPNGANSIVIRSIHYLKGSNPIEGYAAQIDLLRSLLGRYPEFADKLPNAPFPPHMTFAGSGFDFVRSVRNRFAHGSASFPYPDDVGHWCGNSSEEPHVIGISTRIVLLSMQMMLLQHYSGVDFDVCVLCDEDGIREHAKLDLVLNKLHTGYQILPTEEELL